jgi:hypothetical protein
MTPSKQNSVTPCASVRPGLACKELVAGRFVTASANKYTADRSLADAIWEIVAVNEAHLLLKFHGPGRPLDPSRTRRLVPLQEHDFYEAGHLATAIEPPATVPIASIVRMRE